MPQVANRSVVILPTWFLRPQDRNDVITVVSANCTEDAGRNSYDV